MPQTTRPAFIRHYSEIQKPDTSYHRGTDELRSIGSPFSEVFGLARLAIHHEVLPPGRRSSYPHAESAEEEFEYVLEGTPDVWIDGNLFGLAPGDGVGFPAGTGIAHSILNNTDAHVRLLVIGEPARPENRVVYPVNPEMRKLRSDWWEDAPQGPLGSHDGRPARQE